MKRERKELLLKDLCARLPYGLKIKKYDDVRTIRAIDLVRGVVEFVEPDFNPFGVTIERPAIQPYLRPMSSMTEKEKEELKQEHVKDEALYVECLTKAANGDSSMKDKVIIYHAADYCYAHHLDFRGLIPMGIALEAPDGMYKIE